MRASEVSRFVHADQLLRPQQSSSFLHLDNWARGWAVASAGIKIGPREECVDVGKLVFVNPVFRHRRPQNPDRRRLFQGVLTLRH